MEFIEWKNIEHNGRKRSLCPKCSHTRTKNKKDRCLSIDHDKGTAFCHHCESVGFREDVKEKIESSYNLPIQTWKNYTNLSDSMVKFLEGRCISQSTAISLGWTEEEYYQPAMKKKVNNLCFNFFEGETLVNKKYRSGNKSFTQSAGTKSIFYNINSIIGKDEAYIVEGEFDVAALHEVGIKNAISVPNGANDNDEFWKQSETYIKDIKHFIIAVDNDEKGNQLKDKIAHRLGKYRCSYVVFDEKDANGSLINKTLLETIKKAKRFPVSGTYNVTDLKSGILDLYDNGLPDTMSPKSDMFRGMKDVFSVMRGQLNTGTGIPSHGKSNFTDWYVLNLIKDYDLKGSWFSPEHSPMSLYHTNLMEKVVGKSFWGKVNGRDVPRISKGEVDRYEDWANEKVYLTDCVDGEFPTWDWLFDKFKEQMYSFGIDVFVIDAFNKVLLPSGNKLEQVNIVLTKLTSFAQANDVLIFLVAHPTKMQKDENGMYGVPTLYDVSGSADFRNQTHNGYTIYRYWENVETGQEEETEFFNMKTKYNFQGNIGESVKFKYFLENGRFYSNGTEPRQSFFDEKELPVIDPKDAFDYDDIPF